MIVSASLVKVKCYGGYSAAKTSNDEKIEMGKPDFAVTKGIRDGYSFISETLPSLNVTKVVLKRFAQYFQASPSRDGV
jgi:hypothetical protein